MAHQHNNLNTPAERIPKPYRISSFASRGTKHKRGHPSQNQSGPRRWNKNDCSCLASAWLRAAIINGRALIRCLKSFCRPIKSSWSNWTCHSNVIHRATQASRAVKTHSYNIKARCTYHNASHHGVYIHQKHQAWDTVQEPLTELKKNANRRSSVVADRFHTR